MEKVTRAHLAGYMPIPTAEQLAEALENVGSFHDMSAELIAPELLANLLASPAAPTVKAEQVRCATCQGSGIVGHSEVCPECQYTWQPAPYLKAAGSAVEEVEVVGWVDPENIERMKRRDLCGFMIEEKEDSRRSCAVMTVAQHQRIVAALSAQQSAPERVSVPVERIKIALEAVQNAMEDAYNNAYQNCCGRGIGECCGNPEPAWSDADQAIMDALAPAQRELSALLATHAKTGKSDQ